MLCRETLKTNRGVYFPCIFNCLMCFSLFVSTTLLFCMSRKNNIEFEAGYSMGYQHIAFDGGDIHYLNEELLRNRKVSLRTSWAVGFKQGAQDAYCGKPCKY